jgi:hypothetical protein
MIHGERYYLDFIIYNFKAHNTRRYWRIYRNGVFMQTSDKITDAIRLINFCVDNGIWK